MHHFGGGHDRLCGKGNSVQVLDDALGHLCRSAVLRRHSRDVSVRQVADLVQGGHIHAANLRSAAEKLVFAPVLQLCLPQKRKKFVVHFLPLADHKQVEEGRHRLGIHGGGSARPNQRQQSGTVFTAEGKPRHIQHVKNRCVRHFIADGESNGIESGKRIPALQRIQRDPRMLHLGVHIAPGGEHALAPDKGQAVHGVVQDAHAQVGHADFIGVREAEGQAEIHR